MKSVLGICVLFALLAASCATRLPPLGEDVSPAEILQKAQERSDMYDWKGAKTYYQALLERYPDDAALNVQAMYELAFIEYKQGHDAVAIEGFKAVVARYAQAEGATLPSTWKILSEKLLEKLIPPAPVK